MSARYARRLIPLWIMFIVGVVVMAEYFVNYAPLSSGTATILSWGSVMGSIATVVGFLSLLRFNIPAMMKREPLWKYKAWMLVPMISVLVAGLTLTPSSPGYQWMFTNMYYPLFSSVQALMAFFIVYSCYRAFRARNLETFIFVLSGTLMILSYAPMSEAIWAPFGPIGTWIMGVPNKYGMRGITIAAAVGMVIAAVRILLGREAS